MSAPRCKDCGLPLWDDGESTGGPLLGYCVCADKPEPPSVEANPDHTCLDPNCDGVFDCTLYPKSTARMRVVKMVTKERCDLLKRDLEEARKTIEDFAQFAYDDISHERRPRVTTSMRKHMKCPYPPYDEQPPTYRELLDEVVRMSRKIWDDALISASSSDRFADVEIVDLDNLKHGLNALDNYKTVIREEENE